MNNTTITPSRNAFELPSNIATFVLGICGVLTNGILITVTLLDPLKCFGRPSMYFVISLAFSDFFTGILSCLFAWREYFSSKYFLLIFLSALWASVENSFITILLMAIERFIAIRVPIKAKSIMTKRRTLLAIAVTWFVSLLLGAGVSLPEPYKDYIMFGCLIELFLIILVMLVIYLKMLILLRKSSKIFRGKQFTRHACSRSGQTPRDDKKYQHSLNVVVFYLAVVLIITVLPHLIIGQIYVGYTLFYPQRTKPVSLQYAPFISFPVELLNFVLNSVIYAYRLPQFRAALCYYCRRNRKRGRSGSALNSVRNFSKGNHSSDDTMI